MTKSEVRCISLSRLRLQRESTAWDIGAGTGSVSIEMALQAARGMVYAVEKDADACQLIEQNRRQFACTNLRVVHGAAPEVLDGLPAPDCVFVGGSGGNIDEILRLALQRNPYVRVVINAITLETVAAVHAGVGSARLRDVAVSQITASRAKRAGGYHMMLGQNPVYILSGQGGGTMTVHAPRIHLAAPSSGAGKTTATCAVLRAFYRRGLQLAAFKCGAGLHRPYVSSGSARCSFHQSGSFPVGGGAWSGRSSWNMRGERRFPCWRERWAITTGSVSPNAQGVMTMARATRTPVVLIVDGRGAAQSLLAQVKGFLTYRTDSRIAGVIWNRLSPSLYPALQQRLEQEFGIRSLGFLPKMDAAVLESRHLGLVTTAEVDELQQKMDCLAEQAERTVDLDGLLAVAQQAEAAFARGFGASREGTWPSADCRSARPGVLLLLCGFPAVVGAPGGGALFV